MLLNASWLFSLTTLASRVISDDATIFKENWESMDCNRKKCPCFNPGYIFRWLFRCADVIGRIGILSLSWVAINGYLPAALIFLDIFVIACISCKHKK